MRQRDLGAYEKMAVKLFDSYGTSAFSGIAYTCAVLSDYSHAETRMKCMAWVCMN